jgi:hypothetical protein
MACLLEGPLGMEIVAVIVFLFLGLMVLVMIRSKKPDPKMELLLCLMKVFPKEDSGGEQDHQGF